MLSPSPKSLKPYAFAAACVALGLGLGDWQLLRENAADAAEQAAKEAHLEQLRQALKQAQDTIRAGDWRTAQGQLNALRNADPTFEWERVDALREAAAREVPVQATLEQVRVALDGDELEEARVRLLTVPSTTIQHHSVVELESRLKLRQRERQSVGHSDVGMLQVIRGSATEVPAHVVNAIALVEQAKNKQSRGDQQGALELARSALKLDPDNVEAKELLEQARVFARDLYYRSIEGETQDDLADRMRSVMSLTSSQDRTWHLAKRRLATLGDK